MKKITRAALLIAIAFSLCHGQKPAVRSQNANRVQTKAQPASSRVQTIQFASKLVGKTLPYDVLLPVDYDMAKQTRYPVLYLLHGLFGHYDNWITHTKLSDYATKYSLIIVMPEGGDNWYTDSAADPAGKYETYVIEELIPDVQRRYRTLETRAGRGIAGLSMGGYGALKFGVKYPETFAFAGSMSGAIGAASWSKEDLRGLESIWRTMVPVFGETNSQTRRANDVYKLYSELTPERVAALPYVYLDCGTEDPLLPSSRTLVDILLGRKIPHEYRQLPGKHEWPYWDAQVQGVLEIAVRKLSGPVKEAKVKIEKLQSQRGVSYD